MMISNRKSLPLIIVLLTIVFFGGLIVLAVKKSSQATAETISSRQKIVSVQFKLLKKITSKYLNNPFDLFVDSSQNIFVADQSSNYPILALDYRGNLKNGIGKRGRGPGEMEKLYYILGAHQNTISILNLTQLKIQTFNYTGTILFEENIPFSLNGTIKNNVIHLIDGGNSHLISTFKLKKENSQYQLVKLWELPLKKFAQIESFLNISKNPLLKQGKIVSDANNTVFLAFSYSSLLLGISSHGEYLFHNWLPYNIKFPDFTKYGKQYQHTAPPVNEFPFVTIDLAVDSLYLYRVYIGFRTDKIKNPMALMKKDLGQGTILDVYNKSNGQYLFSTKLPIPAKALWVTTDKIYILTTYPEIGISIYEKPQEFYSL